MLIDSHCHLEYEGLVEDQQAVLDRARAAGVEAFLNISTRASEWDRVVGTAHREPDVWASVGIHPHEAVGQAGAVALGDAGAVVAHGEDRVLPRPLQPKLDDVRLAGAVFHSIVEEVRDHGAQ